MEIDRNSFVEQLLPIERDFFFMLNGSDHVFLDSFMFIYSGKLIWIPLFLVALGVFTYKKNWKEVAIFLVCAVLVGVLCDQISASVIKPLFERLRPTHHPDFKELVHVVNNYRGGRLGFVSAHAANGFGVATFFSLLFRYRLFTIVIFSWALITAYSRIYLGVHFITDVIGGILLGISVGLIVYYIYRFARKHLLKIPDAELSVPAYSADRANILCFTIGILILTIVIISTMNFLYGFRWLY